MHRAIEDKLKHDVHDDPCGEHIADSRQAASKQFSSTFSVTEQPEQVGGISNFGIAEPSANPQDDCGHRLQDEAKASWTCESLRQFFEELP